MIRVEIEKTVDRPIEEVFERLVDIPGYREWMPDTGLFTLLRPLVQRIAEGERRRTVNALKKSLESDHD